MATLEEIQKLFDNSIAANNTVLQNKIGEGIKKEFQTFKKEILEEVSTSLREANKKIEVLESKLHEKEIEIDSLKKDLNEISGQTIQLQFDSRRKNVLLFKVPEIENTSNPISSYVVKLITEIADSSFEASDLDNVYRLGAKGERVRPIKLELNQSSKRQLLLANKRKFVERNLGIAEDLPKEISEKRKPLYKLADALRSNGKKVVFKKDKFIVDGEEWNDSKIEDERQCLVKRSRSSPQEVTNPILRKPRMDMSSSMVNTTGSSSSGNPSTLPSHTKCSNMLI